MSKTAEPQSKPSADPLFQPLRIKHVLFRNRFMSTSHACGLEDGGFPTERYQTYHEAKARGGLALTMFGGSSNVAPDSPNIFRQLNVGTDEIIPHLQQFSERIHRAGATLMCQITHLGRRGDPYTQDWLSTIAPSPIRETLHRSFPKEMDEYDIDRVVKAYAAAALRCKEGGLDGIETLTGAHLLGQFLSPKTNKRTDRFGGSFENRCRFPLMVHQAIRKATGDNFLVGMRFTVDEGVDGELTADECIKMGQFFEQNGCVDFFNAIYGSMDTERGLAYENMPGMDSKIAPWVEPVGHFKRAVGVPVFHAARIADIHSARYAIAEGHLDMAGMTRAQIADPQMVTKLREGRESEIRPCVGATHCMSGYRPSCLHNPATGREITLPHIITRSTQAGRRIAVVGGGPAGLEAARVCAERGHRVSLHEAAANLGGQVLLGTRGVWRRDLIGLIDWRTMELERLGVQVHTNSYMEAEDVTALEPDVVIIATGGMPDTDWIDGAAHCTTAWDIISGQIPARNEVLVFDGTGRHPAPQVATQIASDGKTVTFASIDGHLAAELTYAERIAWKRRLYEHKVTTIFDHRLVRVEPVGNRLAVTLANDATLDEQVIQTDQVVVEHGTVPMDDVYKALRGQARNAGVTDIDALLAVVPQPCTLNPEGTFELHRIGDAVSSRNIHAAIYDALRLCVAM